MSVCERPRRELPSMDRNRMPHVSCVLMLTNTDCFLLHFLKMIVCYMERSVANGTEHCVIWRQGSLSCHRSKTQSQRRWKQPAPAVPPCNDELGHCLLKRVTSHIFMTVVIPEHEAKVTNCWTPPCISNVLKGRVFRRMPNFKVARLDYNVKWNIIASPVQCLRPWHNSTGGFKREETFSRANKWNIKQTLEYITCTMHIIGLSNFCLFLGQIQFFLQGVSRLLHRALVRGQIRFIRLSALISSLESNYHTQYASINWSKFSWEKRSLV